MSYVRGVMLVLIGFVAGLAFDKIFNDPFKVTTLLIIGGILIVLYFLSECFLRVRDSLQLEPEVCPKCGAQIKRMHRSWIDRSLGVFVPGLRRFKCKSVTCGWGALVKARPGRKHRDEEITSSEVGL